MSPEAQRIAIAEACGWRRRTNAELRDGDLRWVQEVGSYKLEHFDCPNYLSDLNAMHEAEKVLTTEQRFEYFYQLNKVVGLVEAFSPAWIKEYATVTIACATAAQRVEAFLRTLNLWDDTK